MSFLLIYQTKHKLFNNIESAIEVAKDLPPGKCRIIDDETKREVWIRRDTP